MKVIVIRDDDAKALVDQLELAKFKQNGAYSQGIYKLDEKQKNQAYSAIHRWFHRVVVEWLQEQGADL